MSREQLLALEAQVHSLRESGAWEELEALYENLSHVAPSVEQRLFYSWERAELLAERLEEPVAAINVLREAQLTGGPLGVISLRVEQLRLARVSSPLEVVVNEAALRAYDSMLSLAEGRGQHALPDAERVLGWYNALAPAPRPLAPLVTPDPAAVALVSAPQEPLAEEPLADEPPAEEPLPSWDMSSTAEDHDVPDEVYDHARAPSLDLAEEPLPALAEEHTSAEPEGSFAPLLTPTPSFTPPPSASGSAPALAPRHTLTPSVAAFIDAQDTAFGQDDPSEALWRELMAPQAAELNPMSFLSDLEGLIELRPLTPDEQLLIEPRLWHAAAAKGQWRVWAKLYSSQLYSEEARAPLPPEERARRAYTLAVVYEAQLAELPSATTLFGDVLAIYPQHAEVFGRLRALLRQQRRWQELIALLRAFAPHALPEDRFELAIEVGDIYRDNIKSQLKAIASWFEALELEPDSRQVFVRLLEVYQQGEKWESSIKVLRKLSKLEGDEEKSAYYIYTIGLLQRDRLHDSYLAVRSFDDALERCPRFLKAFQAIEDTLTEPTDAHRRDRYYRKMLMRAIEHELDGTLVAELARQLGRLNLTELKQLGEAQRAYEIALNYQPADDESHRGLIAVKAAVSGPEEAVQHAFQWVRRAPTQVEAYAELYRRAAGAGRLDWAWCAAVALKALSASTPESERLWAEGLPRLGSRLLRPLAEVEWRLLSWSGLDEGWSQLALLSCAQLESALQVKHKSYGVNPKRALIDLTPTHTFGRVAAYLAEHLNLDLLPIWYSALPEGVHVEVVSFGERALCVSEEITLAQPIERLVAHLSYSLYLGQAGRWLSAVGASRVSPEERLARLEHLRAAHLALLGQGAAEGGAAEWLSRLRALPTDAQSQLRLLSPLSDPGKWLRGVEQTAYRVALLMSGDLGATIDLIRGAPSLSGEPFEARLYKLLLFAVSPPYVEIRSSLGLALKVD